MSVNSLNRVVVSAIGMASVVCAASTNAAVNIEFRPPSQTVTNNTTVNVEVYAVSDNASNQAVGRFQVAFTWDPAVLELSGVLENGPYDWFSLGFPSNTVNNPLDGGVPANDGDAFLFALSQFEPNPFADATPAGLLVGTLQFQAIDTAVDSPISIESMISGFASAVLDDPGAGGVDVTGTLGADVTVTSICNNNGDCDDGNDCTTDTCGGQSCSHTNLSSGTSCGDPSDTDCDNPDTCDASGTCQPNYESLGFTCGSPSNTDCDDPDTCDGSGTCMPNYESMGTACGSGSDTECDNPDTCDATGSCLSNFEPSGVVCGSQTVTECDAADSCNGSGACQANFESPGTSCGDGTDDACTDPDSCNGSGSCLPNDMSCPGPTPFCVDDGEGTGVCVECIFGDDAPCNDGNLCTADFCDFGNECRNSADPKNGLPCADSLFCNGAETCQGGICTPPGDPCDDENPCTDDFCDEGDDSCLNVPDNSNDPDDGLFCNGVDTCVGGTIVIGPPPDCDDSNDCTDDACDDGAGSCVYTNNVAECDDGDPCTLDDSCGAGTCIPGPRPTGNGRVTLTWVPLNSIVQVGDPLFIGLYAVSNDGVPDEMFSIDVVLEWDPTLLTLINNVNDGPYSWLLSFFPVDQPLNMTFADGNAAYAALSQLGTPALAVPSPGLHITTMHFDTNNLTPGTQIVIADCESDNGTVTRVDGGTDGLLHGTLNPANVEIVECFTADACDDGVFCNGVEQCIGNTCQPGMQSCDDGNLCTDDICNEPSQACQTIPLTGDFDQNGIFCDGVDRCEAGIFIPGSPINCNDGNPCTSNFCNEEIDACENNPNNNMCSDNDLCTENDACVDGVCLGDPIPGCQKCTFDGQCNDGLACTINDCDDELGVCVFIPDDAACTDDGIFCNGPEVCLGQTGNPTTGCGSLGPPCEDCDEVDGCLCDTPMAEAFATRYIRIEPSAGETEVALVVETCQGLQYVGPIDGETSVVPIDLTDDGSFDGGVGSLVDDPADALWLTPADWGFVVWVNGRYLIPASSYNVYADCGTIGSPSLTASIEVTTPNFGDANGDGSSNFVDIFATVQAFQNFFLDGNDKLKSDLTGSPFCMPNVVNNLADVQGAVQGFQQVPFDLLCPDSVCP